MHLYLPTVDGIAWSDADGAVAEQAQPEWARNATAPEAVTVGLLGVGLVRFGGAVRQVRRER